MLEDFAKRLKEERLRLEANQSQFAVWGGVKKNSQIAYESGNTAPTVEYMLHISEKGADITYIMTGWRQSDGTASIEQDYIFGLYLRLTPREREAVKSLMTCLAGGSAGSQEQGGDFSYGRVHEGQAMTQDMRGPK